MTQSDPQNPDATEPAEPTAPQTLTQAEADAEAAARHRRRKRAEAAGLEGDEDDLPRKGKKRKGRKKRKAAEPAPITIAPMATPAKMRSRHWGVLFSFLFLAAAPIGAVYYYLYTYAQDQYSSVLGFSVRTEEVNSSLDVLGALTGSSSGSSKDTDILYEFVQSQTLVERIDQTLDLRAKWSMPVEDGEWLKLESDPVFAFNPTGTIEDLLAHWSRKVRIDYEASTGLMEITVLAFDPVHARDIAQAIFDESSKMINGLSAIARADATQYARDELQLAEERLRNARTAITAFRERTQVIDPSAVIQGQNGLLNNLQAQLAETLIELDLLRETTRAGDPRVSQAERKVEVIQERIDKEREKFTTRAAGDEGFSKIVSEYENLTVEREFAEQAYLAALSSFDSTLSEARRQSRYLAPHALPGLAERAEYPQRVVTLGLYAMFNLLLWMIGVLIYYSIRDRR